MSENTPGDTTPPQPERPAQPTPPPPPASPPPAAPGGYQPPPAAPGGYQPPPSGGYQPPPAAPGGYQPPPSGGYQPPPVGGYGPPPPGGYGARPSGGADLVMDGVKYGWKKFTENVGPFLIGGLIWFVGIGIVVGILYGILALAIAAGDSNSRVIGFGFSAGSFLLVAVTALLVAFAQVAFLNASLRVAAGNKLEVTDFFRFPNMTAALGTAVIVGIATGIGYALFTLPGIAIAIFTIFAIVTALDTGAGPVDAIKASIDTVKNNFVVALLLALAVYIITAVGSFICGIGIIAAYPIAYVAVVYVYRKLKNQQVAA